jgi:hypothetical protein
MTIFITNTTNHFCENCLGIDVRHDEIILVFLRMIVNTNFKTVQILIVYYRKTKFDLINQPQKLRHTQKFCIMYICPLHFPCVVFTRIGVFQPHIKYRYEIMQLQIKIIRFKDRWLQVFFILFIILTKYSLFYVNQPR